MRGYMDKKILLNKTLRVFLYIEIICISIMILVSGAAGGFYTSSIAAMMIQIGVFYLRRAITTSNLKIR